MTNSSTTDTEVALVDERALDALQGEGALGPVDAFGLVALTDGCRWAGLEVEGGAQASGAQASEHADLK